MTVWTDEELDNLRQDLSFSDDPNLAKEVIRLIDDYAILREDTCNDRQT